MTGSEIKVKVRQADHGAGLPLPRYMTAGSSGADLYAAVAGDVKIAPGKRELVPTGLHVAIPEGYELQIRPRSGLAVKNGIGLLNSPGTIDADYRGEIKVLLVNLGAEPFTVSRGDRIAQAVLAPVEKILFESVKELPPSKRSDGSFGHTGR